MNTHFIRLLAVLFLAAAALHAQVPQLINYQGRVAVDGLNFDGTGQFKFAFVSAAGTTTYWSNDGTSTAGAEPTASVALTVTKGLYSVLLGDATLPGMTIVPATVFTHGDVHLRVWFNDGSHGFQLLTPDKRIAAVGYAMMADSVVDGAITTAKLADGAVTSAKLAPGILQASNIADGAVGSSQLAANAVQAGNIAAGAVAANLNAAGQSGVASGGLVLSAIENPALVDAGYVKIGATMMTVEWQQRFNGTPPEKRNKHTAVWTGSEMIVWGGTNGSTRLSNGGLYNPTTNSWAEVSTIDAPVARESHTAVWTGTEMIIWGGSPGGNPVNDGGRYNPTTNSWTTMSTSGAPSARYFHTAIWTGSEMIVWGGKSGGTYFSDGGRYNPESDSWTALSNNGAPSARYFHTAVWTRSEMIVWGGSNGSTGSQNDGGRYDPTVNSWTTVSTTGAPTRRAVHTAVWTGSEMIVWGGSSSSPFNDGGSYNPVADSWTSLITNGAPSARAYQRVVWTGSEMIVWGGYNNVTNIYLGDGGRYNPTSGSWVAMSTSGAPNGRMEHTAVWTGNEMLIWGGYNDNRFNDTFSYTPGRLLYLYQRP